MILALALLSIDSLFPLSTQPELHLYSSLYAVPGKQLDDKLFPNGPWYPGARLPLSADCTGYIVFNAAHELQLFVYDRQRKQMTDSRRLAGFKSLSGAYEKTTNSWLLKVDGEWQLVTSTFLLDFELEDPSVPNTKNVTGQDSSVHIFKQGRFEYLSNQLPAKRAFPIKR